MNSTDQFEAIVSEYYEPLFRFAMSLTRTESDALDLTQHTFQVWATKGHQLRDITKIRAWLYTTLHRAFLRTRRTQRRFPHQDLEEVMDQLPAVSPVLSDPVDSLPVLPALAKVDETYQAAVTLYYLEDYSYRDIAFMLGVPVGTVKSRIAPWHRAAPGHFVVGRIARFDSPQCGYAEWGFSSSVLLEPNRAVGLTLESQSRLTGALTQK